MSIRRRWKWNLLIWMSGTWLWQAGCIEFFQREVEVLLAPEANPTLIRHSLLVDIFGPGLLKLF